MNYFKINYDKLKHLKIKKLFVLVLIFILFIISFLIFGSLQEVTKKIVSYGIYDGEVLKLKVNNMLSDILKNNNTIYFKGQKTKYKISYFGNYEVIDNLVYQEVYLTIAGDFYPNEVGEVVLYYDKEKLNKYILELFK